jgi:Ca2+-binding RTX toxin-like protein
MRLSQHTGRALVTLAAAVAAGCLPSLAQATVTAQVEGATSDALVVRGDAADDTIDIGCAADGDVAVNGAPPLGAPLACLATRSISVTGGAGSDVIHAYKVRPGSFAEPISVQIDHDPLDPDAASGGDFIRASGFADLIGPCEDSLQLPEIYDENVAGGPGDDLLCGGTDRDFLRGQGGDDRILGGGGEDDLYGSGGDDRVVGGQGPDFLRGGPGADTLIGGPGRDGVVSGPGHDTIHSVEYAPAGEP